jgi:hypothetical protein
MHKTPSDTRYKPLGVPIGRCGQEDGVIKVWTKGRRSCVNNHTASAAEGGRLVYMHRGSGQWAQGLKDVQQRRSSLA